MDCFADMLTVGLACGNYIVILRYCNGRRIGYAAPHKYTCRNSVTTYFNTAAITGQTLIKANTMLGKELPYVGIILWRQLPQLFRAFFHNKVIFSFCIEPRF